MSTITEQTVLHRVNETIEDWGAKPKTLEARQKIIRSAFTDVPELYQSFGKVNLPEVQEITGILSTFKNAGHDALDKMNALLDTAGFVKLASPSY